MTEYIVWVDCEMTGLDIEKDEICEIAVIVTDGELKPVDEGIQIVVKPSDSAIRPSSVNSSGCTKRATAR